MKTGITVKSQISKDLSKPAQYQRKGYEGIRGNGPRAHVSSHKGDTRNTNRHILVKHTKRPCFSQAQAHVGHQSSCRGQHTCLST